MSRVTQATTNKDAQLTQAESGTDSRFQGNQSEHQKIVNSIYNSRSQLLEATKENLSRKMYHSIQKAQQKEE
jgi:hypothetical protein